MNAAGKTCNYPACDTKLRSDNQSGFCTKHFTKAKRAANILSVSETDLDSLWSRLSLEEKAALIFRREA